MREIPTAPEELRGVTVLTRVLDGLAFRFHWATEGLRDEDWAFRPAADCMSALDLVRHVLHLVFMMKQTVLDASERERFRSDDPRELRAHALDQLAEIRAHLGGLADEELATHRVLKRDGAHAPVWNIMNGPIADALTHVGQINAWRRLSGNPTPPIDVFAGRPPA